MRRIDLTGSKFGRLNVIFTIIIKGDDTKYNCQCDCGGSCIVYGYNLNNGNTKSCGCLSKETNTKNFSTHGKSKNCAEYGIWQAIKSRCYREKDKRYNDWGGRGIKMCERWINSFENFFEDMGPRPSNKHSIDRWPNNNGNYEPDNCRWGTEEQQRRGKRNNVWIEYKGQRMIRADWAKVFGIKGSYIRELMNRGKSFEFIHDKYMSNKK